MFTYLLFLVASVFLGSEVLAISTPIAQVTIYRLLSIGLIFIMAIQLSLKNPRLKIDIDNPATMMTLTYVFWLIWAIISVLWSWNIKNWLQANFLLGVGVMSIVGLYLWVDNLTQWKKLLNVIWLMMTFLVIWGTYEILTNHYILADMTKLDPHNLFARNPRARIPITTFANGNDFATLLIAYLTTSVIMYVKSKIQSLRFLYLFFILLAIFLIYRSESRMILLSLFLFIILHILLELNWKFNYKWLFRFIGISILLIILAGLFLEPVQEKINKLIYIGGDLANTGDSRRVNLWRNGLVFLSESFGFGVGAGNIEVWMAERPFLSVDGFTNIHNWWLEILVGYGVFVFVLYSLTYVYMINILFRIRNRSIGCKRSISNTYIAFLIIFIFASVTSANNMLIEWHWVYFGIIISFIKICFPKSRKVIKEDSYEFTYNYE